MVKNGNVGNKFRSKIEISLKKNEIGVKNRNRCQKSKFGQKSKFVQKSKFGQKVEISSKNQNFSQKIEITVKNRNVSRNNIGKIIET